MKFKNLLFTLFLSSVSVLSLTAQCSITNFIMEYECDINGVVNIEYEFDVVDPGAANIFNLYRNGMFVGGYEYGQTTYQYSFAESDCDEIFTFEIVDANDTDCNASFTFDEPFCCWPEDCSMVMELESFSDCDENGAFNINLYVDNPTGSSGGFETVINGVSFGFNDYGLTSYEFGPLEIECNAILDISVIDFDEPDCIFMLSIENEACCDDCTNFVVDYIGDNACTESGTFFAEILIDNPGSQHFEVFIDGISEGVFNYGEEVYSFGPFVGDCNTEHIFDVVDIDSGCESTIVLEPICCSEYCSISDVTVETIECTENGNFSIELNFTFEEVEEDNFDVWSNGTYHGTYAYADLPIIIDDFPSNGNENPFITVFGIGQDILCADDLAFEGLECNGGTCGISDVYAEAYDCNEQGQIFVDIEFDVINPGASNQFTITGNGTSYGTFEYGQTFYTVGPFEPNCDLDYEFVVTDVDNNDCSGFYEYPEALCCNVDECSITNVEAEALCTDDELFLDVWFGYDNPGSSNQFMLNVSGQEFGPFEYGESFYNIGPMWFPCEPFQPIEVMDLDDENCIGFFELELPEGLCCEQDECTFENVEVEPQDCNEGGEIYFDIYFDVLNPGSDNQFTVAGNGNNYGTFEYGEDFYTVGPFLADCETVAELIITDLNNDDCFAVIEFDEVFCCDAEACNLHTLDFGANPECIDGLIVTDWLIDGDNLSEVGFDIFINDAFETYVEWNANSWYAFDIEDPQTEIFTIKVCDNDNENCCIEWELENPCYEPSEECSITNLGAEAYDCNEDGEIYFDIFFDINNPGTDNQFTVVGNGNDYGTFEYGEDYYTVGPFLADCETEVELIITDLNNIDCSAFIGFNEVFCCEEDECAIVDLTVETTECDDGTDIEINFEMIGGSGDVYITLNDDTFGPYDDLVLPITYISFLYDTEYITVTVCDAIDPDCCATVEVLNPCYNPEEECNITTLDFGPNPECVDGLIVTEWLIDGENLSEVGFDIYINNLFETFVEWNENSWYDFDIENPNTEVFTIKVCDNDNDDCCIEWELENPCYDPDSSDCSISELTIDADCEDGNTTFELNFDYENNISATFQIVVNDDFIESYAYDNLPILVSGLNYETEYITITVTDNEDADCTAVSEFENPCYEDGVSDCSISEVFVEALECNDDDQVYFHLTFEYENIGDDNQFTVVGNGNNYGTFEYGLDYYEIGPIEADCETELEFVVTDINFENCNAFVVHEPVCCDDESECGLSDFSADATECSENNSFNLTIDIEVTGETNDFFDLFINGESIGFYEFEDLPITLSELLYETEYITVEVCDNDNEDCCLITEIINPCFEEENQEFFINEIEFELESCENDLVIMSVDFQHGDNEDQFEVRSNGISYGIYDYSALPIIVENITADGTTDYTFSIEDISIEDLVSSFEVGTLLCDGDVILDVEEQQLDPSEIKSIKAFDITGKYLGDYSFEESQKIIDLDRSVSSGILILRIETATKVLTKKIVRVN